MTGLGIWLFGWGVGALSWYLLLQYLSSKHDADNGHDNGY